MRFLGITETCDLGSLYMRLIDEGHEVRVAVTNPLASGTMRGIVPRIANWKDNLEWVQAAGDDGIILIEAVSEGFGELQDELRAQGCKVIGGSAFGDRLENDRAFGQALLGSVGFPTGHLWEFTDIASAAAQLRAPPCRTVLKYSGAGSNSLCRPKEGTRTSDRPTNFFLSRRNRSQRAKSLH